MRPDPIWFRFVRFHRVPIAVLRRLVFATLVWWLCAILRCVAVTPRVAGKGFELFIRDRVRGLL